MKKTMKICVLLVVLGLSLQLAGCSLLGPSQEDRAAALAQQLEEAAIGVKSADVVYQSSFSGDLSVAVVLADSVLETDRSISIVALKRILADIARGAEDMRTATVTFAAQDDDEEYLSLDGVPAALGVGVALGDLSVTFSRAEFSTLAKG